MVRWVVKHEDGTLDIHTTGGNQPDNALCAAHRDWTTDIISESDGIVFLDPKKVRALRSKLEKEKSKEKRELRKQKIIRFMHKVSPLFWFAIGYGACNLFRTFHLAP